MPTICAGHGSSRSTSPLGARYRRTPWATSCKAGSRVGLFGYRACHRATPCLSLIHISEPTRLALI
eukprot:8669012-Alexandrium_andersonii.AAC.1